MVALVRLYSTIDVAVITLLYLLFYIDANVASAIIYKNEVVFAIVILLVIASITRLFVYAKILREFGATIFTIFTLPAFTFEKQIYRTIRKDKVSLLLFIIFVILVIGLPFYIERER